MAAKHADYRSSGFHSTRTLRFDRGGIRYDGPGQTVRLEWSEIQALVSAAVEVDLPSGDHEALPMLGIVLRLPFPQPAFVDGVLPNLDYAIPIGDLKRWPLLGIGVSPEEIVEAALGYAQPVGVRLLASS